MARYYQGIYKLKNPQKYKGDPTKVVFRSRWEAVIMKRFDEHPDVICWSSEEVVVGYRSPIDNRIHRYFIDFYVKKKRASDGKIVEELIEVKPKAQTVPPKIMEGKKKPSKRYIQEVQTWGVNSAKWKAAEEYCKDRGYTFVILTEEDIF